MVSTVRVRFTRGADTVDLRGYPGFPTKAEDPEGKFVLHALESRNPKFRETRGTAVEMTNKQWEEIQTNPLVSNRLIFEVVTPEEEAAGKYRMTLGKDMFNRPTDPRTGLVIRGQVSEHIAEQLSQDPGKPKTKMELRQEVKQEVAAGEKTGTPTP